LLLASRLPAPSDSTSKKKAIGTKTVDKQSREKITPEKQDYLKMQQEKMVNITCLTFAFLPVNHGNHNSNNRNRN